LGAIFRSSRAGPTKTRFNDDSKLQRFLLCALLLANSEVGAVDSEVKQKGSWRDYRHT